MIQVENLRIGNYVTIVKDGLPTSGLVMDMVWAGNAYRVQVAGAWAYAADLEPIEVTNDWLEGFGFNVMKKPKHHKGDYVIYFTDFADNECYIIVWQAQEGCIALVNSEIAIPIAGIHQLQTLFFSLAGGELTIEQPTQK